MDRRFEIRKQQLLADCRVPAEVFGGMVRRLKDFAEPFVGSLCRSEQKGHARTYLCGLLSDLQKKNAEAIAYRHDRERMGLQMFIGSSPWDHQPLMEELVRQVAVEIGEADGVLSFDPSAFAKKGNHSVGVQRQWCGRLGKIENCQVGVFMGYASRKEQALVGARLFLPKQWCKDKHRRAECGVPKQVRFRTRHQLALEMLDESAAPLPHAWITGDDEMGRSYAFRRDLADRNEQYLLAIPSNLSIRDLQATPPVYGGRGPRPKTPFQQVRKWAASLPADAWTRLEVRDAEKGPLVVEIVKRSVCGRTDRKRVAPSETLVAVRWQDEERTTKVDYYFSNAPIATPLEEFARVSKAHGRIEQCIKRSKSETGLGQYQVRSWNGWHHHVTLSFVATWFLVHESRRGKKMDAGHHRAADSPRLILVASPTDPVPRSATDRPRPHPLARAK
jgi:SRSO17 transposase